MTDWSDWVGREETRSEVLDRTRSDALLAALGAVPAPGDELPPPHHWLHFWDVKPPGELGEDGHPAKGGFLPPVPLPRRMWAGGRLAFHGALSFGERVERRSTIRAISRKTGRSGDLVFVTVAHRLTGSGGAVWDEEQDLVYRPASTGPTVSPPPDENLPAPDWRQGIVPDPVLLFRYSALTMNGHRIHYDAPYARAVEHYPGLVVQGPLQASLMLGAAIAAAGRQPKTFAFRGLSPAIADAEIAVCGRDDVAGVELWVEQGGRRTMSGRVEWETAS
jgi:3-methylfumaryl-CoA hydratase